MFFLRLQLSGYVVVYIGLKVFRNIFFSSNSKHVFSFSFTLCGQIYNITGR